MSATTKTSKVDALQVEYQQLRERAIRMAERYRDPNDPRRANLLRLENELVAELRALGAEPDQGGAQ